jgi:hypothetical protein
MYSTIAHVFANMSSVSDAKPELNMFNMQCLLSPSTPTIRTPASPLCSSAWGELGQLRFMPQFRVVEVEGLSEKVPLLTFMPDRACSRVLLQSFSCGSSSGNITSLCSPMLSAAILCVDVIVYQV